MPITEDLSRYPITITEDSHADHLPPRTLGFALGCIVSDEADEKVNFGTFAIYEVHLAPWLPEDGIPATVPCALRGPATGEEPVDETQVHYGTRGGRPNVSRLTSLPATRDHRITVLLAREKREDDWTLVTAYGGPLAPQEPGDPYLPAEKHAESVAFWSQHALSVDGSPDSTRVDGHSFEAFSAPAERAE